MSKTRLARLLAGTARAGVYCAPSRDMASLLAAARDAGILVLRVDLAGVRDKAGFLQAVARALRFPEWFGHNWDALHDCLTDLSWLDGKAFAVVWEHAKALHQAAPADFSMAVSIFDSAAEEWRRLDVALWTLVDAEGAGIKNLSELA